MTEMEKQKRQPRGRGLPLPRLVLWTLQGCGYLEGYGHHPGTGFMVILLLSGAAAGSDGGWIGSLIGMAAMACTFGVLYLSGAYSRAKAFHSENISYDRQRVTCLKHGCRQNAKAMASADNKTPTQDGTR